MENYVRKINVFYNLDKMFPSDLRCYRTNYSDQLVRTFNFSGISFRV
jgi:hypothetical protein